jgi:hypothetical protein
MSMSASGPTRRSADAAARKASRRRLHWHGTDAAVSASDNYVASRRLALALHAAFPDIDGLAYRARHNNGEVCYALFDRVSAADLVPGAPQRLSERSGVVDHLMALNGALFDADMPVPPPESGGRVVGLLSPSNKIPLTSLRQRL